MLFTSSSRLFLASFALTWAVSTAEPIWRRDDSCKDVHIFLAKGNNEPYPGRQGKLAGAICYGLDSCDYEDIQYYNPVEADYCASVTEGAQNGLSQVTAYAARCPDAKLVLSGYSQGAQIVGDVLGGGGGVFFNNCTQPVNAALDPTTSPGNKSKLYLPYPASATRMPVLNQFHERLADSDLDDYSCGSIGVR